MPLVLSIFSWSKLRIHHNPFLVRLNHTKLFLRVEIHVSDAHTVVGEHFVHRIRPVVVLMDFLLRLSGDARTQLRRPRNSYFVLPVMPRAHLLLILDLLPLLIIPYLVHTRHVLLDRVRRRHSVEGSSVPTRSGIRLQFWLKSTLFHPRILSLVFLLLNLLVLGLQPNLRSILDIHPKIVEAREIFSMGEALTSEETVGDLLGHQLWLESVLTLFLHLILLMNSPDLFLLLLLNRMLIVEFLPSGLFRSLFSSLLLIDR